MKSLLPMVFIPIIIAVSLGLSACSAARASDLQAAPAVTAAGTAQGEIAYPASDASQDISAPPANQPRTDWPDGQAQKDAQGAVEVTIIPLNLNNPGDTLDFEVSLNTHSVDLSMDLATLANLTTDTGLVVKASLWEAPLGGHHVSGVLSFPSSLSGVPVLEGATRLTLTLISFDAAERVFTWER